MGQRVSSPAAGVHGHVCPAALDTDARASGRARMRLCSSRLQSHGQHRAVLLLRPAQLPGAGLPVSAEHSSLGIAR